MIGIVDVAIQAENPSMPLYPMRAFVSSPSSIRVRNVPKKIGDWAITKVYFTAVYPDGQITSTQCVLVGGVWVGTINGTSTSGTSENGYTIFADGTDENGNDVTGYILGKGDIQILEADGTITPTAQKYYVHLLDEQPENPVEGDLYNVSGTYYIWQNGVANPLSIPIEQQLTQAQKNALNSGITSYKVAQIGTWQYPFVDIYASEQPATWTYSGYDMTLYDVGMEPYFDISLGVWQMSMIPIADPGDVFFLTANGDEQSTVLNFYGDEVHPVSVTATQFIYQRIDVTSYKNNVLQSNYFHPNMPIVFGSILGQNTRMDDFYITIDGTALTQDLGIAFNSEYVITQNRFHPRTDAETDFVIKAGCWNVFMIFEYRENHFMVSRWTETEGGAE